MGSIYQHCFDMDAYFVLKESVLAMGRVFEELYWNWLIISGKFIELDIFKRRYFMFLCMAAGQIESMRGIVINNYGWYYDSEAIIEHNLGSINCFVFILFTFTLDAYKCEHFSTTMYGYISFIDPSILQNGQIKYIFMQFMFLHLVILVFFPMHLDEIFYRHCL